MKHLFTKICIALIFIELIAIIALGVSQLSIILMGIVFLEELLILLYELTK